MKGDFSRVTFDPTRHFSQVLMQQGRVLLADDLNEASDIFTYLLRTFIGDMVGPYAGPWGKAGFEIRGVDLANNMFTISEGRYYVGGLLCVNEGTGAKDASGATVLFTYKTQPHYHPVDDKLPMNPPLVVYLDAWERHVSAVELDAIREQALGGPDTATRAQVVWQIRTESMQTGEKALTRPTASTGEPAWWADVDAWLASRVKTWQPENRGWLSARLRPATANYTDPCITPPKAGYRGETNQLYRVEISAGSTKDRPATFKWSRENGSVVTSWLDTDNKDLFVTSSSGFNRLDWVELLDDNDEWAGRTGRLFQVDGVAAGRITLKTAPGAPADAVHARVRRWDQKFTKNLLVVDGCVPIVEATTSDGDKANWIDLENGIQVQFRPPETGANTYRTGDYWLIPVRVGEGIDLPGKLVDDVWESDVLPPRGVIHHYAPLAFIETGGAVSDLRRLFAPSLTPPPLLTPLPGPK
jgi:hypothetical protein